MSALTEKGLLSARPAPSTNPAGYYYATDQGKYYKSNGDTWTEIATDFEDIDPRTKISLMAGLDQDGTIDTVKLMGGALNVASTNVPGFNIPNYTKVELTYYDSTNNIETVVYKKGEDVVATLTITYNDSESATPLVTAIQLD
jgi:hypothetical protein